MLKHGLCVIFPRESCVLLKHFFIALTDKSLFSKLPRFFKLQGQKFKMICSQDVKYPKRIPSTIS